MCKDAAMNRLAAAAALSIALLASGCSSGTDQAKADQQKAMSLCHDAAKDAGALTVDPDVTVQKFGDGESAAYRVEGTATKGYGDGGHRWRCGSGGTVALTRFAWLG